jgi:K+-transporting ATPase KdpF subunit
MNILPFLQHQWQHRRLSCQIFLALCLNLLLSPAVLAATGGSVSRLNAYAIGLLGLVVLGLAIYLLTVMLQPQRF